jgi:hypothetical protein
MHFCFSLGLPLRVKRRRTLLTNAYHHVLYDTSTLYAADMMKLLDCDCKYESEDCQS